MVRRERAVTCPKQEAGGAPENVTGREALRAGRRARGLLPAFVVAAAAVATLAAEPDAASATWAGKPGMIAYQDLSRGLYTVRPNGKRRRRIVRGTLGGIAWSRDGKRIAFYKQGWLYHARGDGRRRRRIVNLAGVAYSVAWSPGGRRLVFQLEREKTVIDDEGQPSIATVDEIWTVRRDGKRLRKLGAGNDPTWSVRDRLVFSEDDGDIVSVTPSGKRYRVLHRPGGYSHDLDFSPDGRRLVFGNSTDREGGDTIRTLDLRSGRETRFRAGTPRVNAFDLAWTPSGRRIAYIHSTPVDPGTGPTRESLWTIRADGERARRLFKFRRSQFVTDFAWRSR